MRTKTKHGDETRLIPAAKNYQVIVGNIGTVYDGNILKEALESYKEYRVQSASGYGRASGESVVMLENGEVKYETFSSNPQD